MDWQKYIERVPGVMLGKPIFRETRLTVEFVLERLAQGAHADELICSHPTLSAQHIWRRSPMLCPSCAKMSC